MSSSLCSITGIRFCSAAEDMSKENNLLRQQQHQQQQQQQQHQQQQRHQQLLLLLLVKPFPFAFLGFAGQTKGHKQNKQVNKLVN